MEQLIQRGTIGVFFGVQKPGKTEKSLISFDYDCIALFWFFFPVILHSIVKYLLKVKLTEAKQKYITVYTKQNL